MSTDALEASLDTLRFWLIVWTAVVALGLVVEYALPIRNFLVASFLKLFKSRTPEKRLFSTLVVGGLLITGGVIGEMWVEVLSARIETDLRAANALVIAALIEKAANAGRDAESAKATARGFELAIADANKRAAEATARVKGAEAQIVSANAASRDAVARVAIAQARIAEAEARAAEARAVAERAASEMNNPAALTAPRRLTSEHLEAIINAAKRFDGRAVTIASPSDLEAAVLAGEIAFALRSAGLTTKEARTPAEDLPVGILVGGPTSEHDLIDGLRSILKAESGFFVANDEWPPSTRAGQVAIITVGLRPATPIPTARIRIQ